MLPCSLDRPTVDPRCLSALISRRCRLSTPYTHVHHTIGPDLDTIRAVLNPTFRRFGRFGPSFFPERSPPSYTDRDPPRFSPDEPTRRQKSHRKCDNPFRVSQEELPLQGISSRWLGTTPSPPPRYQSLQFHPPPSLVSLRPVSTFSFSLFLSFFLLFSSSNAFN